MKRFFAAAILLVGLTFAQVSAAPQHVLPPAEVDLKLVIDVLADYDVVHKPDMFDMVNSQEYWGMTDYRTSTILISDRPDMAIRKLTVIHELIHAIYNQKAVNTGGPMEAWVESEAIRIYTELYGLKP